MKIKKNKFFKDMMYILLLLIIVSLFFYKVILNPDKLVYSSASDHIHVFEHFKHFIFNSIEKYGELPLWNPFILSSGLFIGDPETFVFYPINLLYFFLNDNLVTNFSIIFHTFLLGLFTYFFMRVIKVSRFGSFISALLLTFSGKYMVSILIGGHTTFLNFAWTPLIFALFELSIRKGKLFYSILAGVAMAFQLMGIHPQLFFYSTFCFSFYALFRTFPLIKKSVKNIKYILLPFLFLVLVSSVQLIPALELSLQVDRGGDLGWDFVSSFSLPPKQLIAFILPNFFGSVINHTYWGSPTFWSLTAYLGIVPLILALFALLFNRNRYVYFFGGLVIFSLLFAFGRYGPIYYFFYKFVPILNKFRIPSRMLYMYTFSIAILAGFGVDFIITKIKNKALFKKILMVMVIVAIISLISIPLLLVSKDTFISYGQNMVLQKYDSGVLPSEGVLSRTLDYYLKNTTLVFNGILKDIVIFTITFASFTILLLLLLLKKIRIMNLKFLLVLIILFGLWSFALPMLELEDFNDFYEPSDMIRFLEKDKTLYRALDIFPTIENPAILSYLTSRHGIYQPNILRTVLLKRYKSLTYNLNYNINKFSEMHKNTYTLLNLLNIKYLVTRTTIENEVFLLVYNKSNVTNFNQGGNKYLAGKTYLQDDTAELYMYLNSNYLPRAYVVPNALVIKDEKSIIDIINSTSFDPRKFAIIEEQIEGNLINKGEFKEAAITYYSPNRITVEVNLSHPGFLVLSETMYPGWNAYENNREYNVLTVNHLFRGLYLNKGNHKIEFVFEPISYKIGLFISISTLLFILVLIIFRLINTKKYKT